MYSHNDSEKLAEFTGRLKDTGHIFADKSRTRRRHEAADTVRLALVPVDKSAVKSDTCKFTEPKTLHSNWWNCRLRKMEKSLDFYFGLMRQFSSSISDWDEYFDSKINKIVLKTSFSNKVWYFCRIFFEICNSKRWDKNAPVNILVSRLWIFFWTADFMPAWYFLGELSECLIFWGFELDIFSKTGIPR